MRIVAVAIVLSGALIAAAILLSAAFAPRYAIAETSGGFDRIDLRTGTVEHCDALSGCAPDDPPLGPKK